MCSHTYGIGSPVKHLNDLVHWGRFALACVSHRAGGLSGCLSLGMCVWGSYQTPWGYLHNIFSSAAGLTVPVAGAYWYTLVCLLTSHHTHTSLFKISHKVQETIDGICIAVHSQGAIWSTWPLKENRTWFPDESLPLLWEDPSVLCRNVIYLFEVRLECR